MYKSVSSYLSPNAVNLFRPYSGLMDLNKNIEMKVYEPYPQSQSQSKPQQPHRQPYQNPRSLSQQKKEQHTPVLKWSQKSYPSVSNPHVWGPSYWFNLHTSALFYPIDPSPIVRDRMKARILAIPIEIPCAACKPHASAFIESVRDRLDHIVSSRKNLFNFYVDFHNKVNQRYNKKVWSYEEAWNYYSGPAVVSMSY